MGSFFLGRATLTSLSTRKKILFFLLGSSLVLFSLGIKYQKLNPSLNNPPAIASLGWGEGFYWFFSQEPEPIKNQETPLDGVKVTAAEWEEIKQRLPLGVMVENHFAARPVAGINAAEMVNEALVEGGITRFLLFFWREKPELVGPVRSLRTYYLDWLSGLPDALIMHIGYAQSSNPAADAWRYLQRYQIKTLGFGRNFWRDYSRRAPHNAYVSTPRLWEKAAQRGWAQGSSFRLWQFKADRELSQRPPKQEIKISWNGWGETPYAVRWVYQREKNIYQRFYASSPAQTYEMEEGKKVLQPIWAKNILVLLTPYSSANDGTARIVYQTLGQGKALVFRDGEVITGSWEKKERRQPLKILNSQGEEITLNRGRIWLMFVPPNSIIEY